jgi:hypothetical protein
VVQRGRAGRGGLRREPLSSEIEAGEGVWYIRSMHPIPHGELRRGSHGRADVCAHALLETFHHRLAALEAGRTGAP